MVMPPHATLGLVAYVKSTNSELCCFLSRFFSPRKPSLTFAAQVSLQKIYSACPETEHTHSQHAREEKAGESSAPHVPRAPAVSVIQQPSHSDPLSPLTVVSPNFTKSMSFLQCFGGLNLGQEYQRRAAGTDIQPLYLIRYSRMR